MSGTDRQICSLMNEIRNLLVLIGLLVATSALAETSWQPLVTGENFPQWTVAGGGKADFNLNGNVVSGQPIGQMIHNSFLCSPDSYKDFELKFEFHITPSSLNSGLQFRSEVYADGVRGPQLEMDIFDPVEQQAQRSFYDKYIYPIYLWYLDIEPHVYVHWPSAAIYGEAMGTSWLYPGIAGGDQDAFGEQGGRLTKRDGWNAVRLRAEGPRIQSWLNGELRADFTYEPTDKAGLICLQVHGGNYEDPRQFKVEWRDLMIRELPGK